MTAAGDSRLRQAVHKALTQEAGSDADAKALATAALRLYGALAQQLTPLIGDGGVTALMARSMYLTQREFPWLADARDRDQSAGAISQVGFCLERQEPAVGGRAVVALFAMFGGLLANMIGDPLTIRLLRHAWPIGFSDEPARESHR